MNKISIIIIVLFISSSFLVQNIPTTEDISNSSAPKKVLQKNIEDFQFCIEKPTKVSIKFDHELTKVEIQDLKQAGITFTGNVGNIYLATLDKEQYELLKTFPGFVKVEPQIRIKDLPPRDISIPEIKADLAWNLLNNTNVNITGKDILVADLDTGINWRHPDFFYADGGVYNWIDTNSDGELTNGTDAIDINNNSIADSNETCYYEDVNGNGRYDPRVDWLWLDNGSISGVIENGEPFFVVNDTTGDGLLNTSEQVIMLKTPKTKYIFHMNGNNLEHWEKDVNLTQCTLQDVDGHGTSVAGIINGGQIGYRDYVGVAPDAELMMIKVFDSDGLSVDEALQLAQNHSADVILIELGSWTFHYLDGSSNVETMINNIVNSGIPVIAPAGNLGGSRKHARNQLTAHVPKVTHFNVTPYSPDINEVYITILTRDTQDTTLNISIHEQINSTYYVRIPINPGIGYYNFQLTPGSNVDIYSFVSNSSRGTHMVAIVITGRNGAPLVTGSLWAVNLTSNYAGTYHYYISDAQSSWSGGTFWVDDAEEKYIITWPSTADKALSIASYHTRSLWATAGSLASYSPEGPRIDGVLKMGVAAPGGWDIISTWANESGWSSWYDGYSALALKPVFGGYRLFSGTSAAGPHVAGAAALLMQVNSSAGSIIPDILKETARNDSFVGDIPNNQWGYGKIDVYQAVLKLMDSEPPNITNVNITPSNPNYDEKINISANIADSYSSVSKAWINWSVSSESISHIQVLNKSGNSYATQLNGYPYGTILKFRIYANDSSNNIAVTSEYQVIFTDRVDPVILQVDLNTSIVFPEQAVQINVSASDISTHASGIYKAYLNWTSDNWTSFTVETMTDLGSNKFTGVIQGYPANTLVRYVIFVNDTAGNSVISSEYSYKVQAYPDVTPPVISKAVLRPTTPIQGSSGTIYVFATDNSGTVYVTISYSFNGVDWTNITATKINETTYSATINYGQHSMLYIKIYARDPSNNYVTLNLPAIPIQTSTSPSSGTSSNTTEESSWNILKTFLSYDFLTILFLVSLIVNIVLIIKRKKS